MDTKPNWIPGETKQCARRPVSDHFDESPNGATAWKSGAAPLGFGADWLRWWVRQ